MILITIAVLALAGVILRAATSEAAPTVSQSSDRDDLAWETVEIRTNGRGKLLQIKGPDPRMVLRAFCEPVPTRRLCEPVEIRMTNPPQASRRVGIFRKGEGLGLGAIEIVRLNRPQSWTAGDGLNPISVIAAPERSAEAAVVPVLEVR